MSDTTTTEEMIHDNVAPVLGPHCQPEFLKSTIEGLGSSMASEFAVGLAHEISNLVETRKAEFVEIHKSAIVQAFEDSFDSLTADALSAYLATPHHEEPVVWDEDAEMHSMEVPPADVEGDITPEPVA